MLFILTQAELAKERESLRGQLTDQTTLATAKAIVVDGFREAIDLCIPDLRRRIIADAERLSRAHWEKFPANSPVREYFERSGPDIDPA